VRANDQKLHFLFHKVACLFFPSPTSMDHKICRVRGYELDSAGSEYVHTVCSCKDRSHHGKYTFLNGVFKVDRLGLEVRVLGYRSGGPGSIPGTTRKKK
jgi:hypothetical protein